MDYQIRGLSRIPSLVVCVIVLYVVYVTTAEAKKGQAGRVVNRDTVTNVQDDGKKRRTEKKSNWTDNQGKKGWSEEWEENEGGSGEESEVSNKYKYTLPEGTILDLAFLVDRSCTKVLGKAAKLVRIVKEISNELPGSRFGVSYFSNFQCKDRNLPKYCEEAVSSGKEHEDAEGCYQFGKGLDPYLDLVPAAVEEVTPLVSSGGNRSALAAMMMTAVDPQMDWFEGKKRAKVIFLITGKGTSCCKKPFGTKTPPVGDGHDRCAKMNNPTPDVVGKIMRNNGVGLFLVLTTSESTPIAIWKQTVNKLKIPVGLGYWEEDKKLDVWKKLLVYVEKLLRWKEKYEKGRKVQVKVELEESVHKKVEEIEEEVEVESEGYQRVEEKETSGEVEFEHPETSEEESGEDGWKNAGRRKGEEEVTTETTTEEVVEAETTTEEMVTEETTTEAEKKLETTTVPEESASDEVAALENERPRRRIKKKRIPKRRFDCCPLPPPCLTPCGVPLMAMPVQLMTGCCPGNGKAAIQPSKTRKSPKKSTKQIAQRGRRVG